MAQDNRARQTAQSEIASDVEKALAEIFRLRAWLTILSNIPHDNNQQHELARRVRYIARRALAGESVYPTTPQKSGGTNAAAS